MARPKSKVPKTTIAIRTEAWKAYLLKLDAEDRGENLQEALRPTVDRRARRILRERNMTLDQALRESEG